MLCVMMCDVMRDDVMRDDVMGGEVGEGGWGECVIVRIRNCWMMSCVRM